MSVSLAVLAANAARVSGAEVDPEQPYDVGYWLRVAGFPLPFDPPEGLEEGYQDADQELANEHR